MKLSKIFVCSITLICLICYLSAIGQEKELPKFVGTTLTQEEINRNQEEVKRKADFENRQKEERIAWEMKHRKDEYAFIVRNDIFRFGFLISIIIGLIICEFGGKRKGLEYYVPAILIFGLYLLQIWTHSKEGEYSTFFSIGILELLIYIVVSTLLISLLTKITILSFQLARDKSLFVMLTSLVFSFFLSYILTGNIESSDENKPIFISNPWNWIAFFILNGFLYYRLKINVLEDSK